MATLIVRGLDHRQATEALSMALGSPFGMTGAHIPDRDRKGGNRLTRLEGFSISVYYRINELKRLLKRFRLMDLLEGNGVEALWQSVRRATRAFGGHATLLRALAEIRSTLDVFEPQSKALMTLTRGIKVSFDPAGILNLGRMDAGI